MTTDVDEFIAHYGVKGMKWGVRRAQSRTARTARIKSGKATKRDRLIREMDLDGGRTEAIKKGEIKGPSKAERVGMAAVGVVLLAHGGKQLYDIKRGW